MQKLSFSGWDKVGNSFWVVQTSVGMVRAWDWKDAYWITVIYSTQTNALCMANMCIVTSVS